MLTKSLEFTTMYGQKVKIHDIPVLAMNHKYFRKTSLRLNTLCAELMGQEEVKQPFSFKDYLEERANWQEHLHIYGELPSLKYHA